MLQNVLSFWTKYHPYFQMALGVWQILKSTPPGAVIQGVMVLLGSIVLPGVFPAYKQLERSPGCLFKTVKCVVLTKGDSQPVTNPRNQGTTTSDRSACMPEQSSSTVTNLNRTDASRNLKRTVESRPGDDSVSVDYLRKRFVVQRDGNKVSVGEWSYYNIRNRQWEKICQMDEKCFKRNAGEGSENENKVVFVKGCQFIWQKVATGEVMEFGEVLDDLIFENNDTVLISNDVWFLPVDLSEKSAGKLPKLLNLVGLFFSTHKKPSLLWSAIIFSIVSAILEIKPVRSCIYGKINKMFCGSVQYICNKLPYPVRRFVYLLFIWVENLMPRNDILLQVVRRDWDVVIGGSFKTNRAQDPTRVDWLNRTQSEFPCGSSIVMKATYNEATEKCTATVQHNNFIRTPEQRVLVNCQSRREFTKIRTFLWCLSTYKAGSLFKYDCDDNIVHVRKWRGSLRAYVDAGFPDIYKLRLHDVIV